jgi:predicted protein tyrosine phosphatase
VWNCDSVGRERVGMEIRIGGYVAASYLLEREPNQWHAIVMLDSGRTATDFVQAHTRSHLFLQFDDVEEHRENKRAPTKNLIEQALAFATGKDKLLVCCRAGQGRSAALAYVLACREHGVAEALKLLNPTRHRPNRLVVAIGDSVLGTAAILDQFDEWRHRHSHIRLADYSDEIVAEIEALEAQGASNRICLS